MEKNYHCFADVAVNVVGSLFLLLRRVAVAFSQREESKLRQELQ